MKTSNRFLGLLRVTTAIAMLSTAPQFVGGCGERMDPKVAKVQPGDMPNGAEWSGVYFSAFYGYLHVTQSGKSISGKWIRPQKDRWGELHGNVTANLLRFAWTEHTVGIVGPGAERAGRGYFKYKRPAGENVDDVLNGEMGFEQADAGNSWNAVKQRNMMPDLASIGLGMGSADLGGGDWDTKNEESGKAEPPVNVKKGQ